MKHLPFVLILMSLAACGGGSSSANKGSEENPLKPCGGKTLCIQPVNYILNTRLTNLSEKLRVNIVHKQEGREDRKYAIVDSCRIPGELKIIANATGSSIFFSHNPFMNEKSSLELVDLGEDCNGTTVVIRTDLTEETFRVDSESRTINVDLD